MLDIQLLRTDLDAVARRLADRGFEFPVAAFQPRPSPAWEAALRRFRKLPRS